MYGVICFTFDGKVGSSMMARAILVTGPMTTSVTSPGYLLTVSTRKSTASLLPSGSGVPGPVHVRIGRRFTVEVLVDVGPLGHGVAVDVIGPRESEVSDPRNRRG